MEEGKYTNGQKNMEMIGDKRVVYYRNGKVRAEGAYIAEKMEGEWTFFRETGQLWQIGNFLNNMKHGLWVRYDREGKIEYQETFVNNKMVKK